MARGNGNATRALRPAAFTPFTAKLARPDVDAPLVDRPRLVDDLLAFDGRHVVLSAPAGYGKSTLAAQWLATEPRAGAWLSLDAADNDPHVLLTYLGLALDGIEPIGDEHRDTLAADAELDDLMSALTALLAARTTPFVLVVDDAHVLTGRSRDDVLATLAGGMPAGSTLVVATRDPAPFPTSRAAIQGTTTTLSTADLAMTDGEADILLRGAGVESDGPMLATIQEITEGWPAGLYLASIALRDTDDVGRVVISGRQRRVAEFFAEEVLPSLAPDDVEFLLATAVLERCCGALCDAALRRDGSAAVLERLAHTNQFVIALDDTGEWYRYHHLFADMLRAEQARRDPAAAALVARRASEWWEQRFEPDAAVSLSLAASDRARVVDLVSRFAPILQNDRRHATVGRWLDAFSEDEITAEPALALTAAWNALVVGDTAGVHRYASAVEVTTRADPLPDGTPPRAAARLLQALTTSRGLTDQRDHAAQAFADHPGPSAYRAIAALLEGGAGLMLGEVDTATPVVETSIALGHARLLTVRVQGLANRARVDAMAGDWDGARRTIDDAMALLDEYWLGDRPAMALVVSAASLIHARSGFPGRADAEREQALGLLLRLEDVTPFNATCSMIELAESALCTGHVDDAADLLAEAERRLRRLRDTGLLPFAAARVGALVGTAAARPTSTLVDPLSPAEGRVLQYLPTHLSFGEIGEELFVSRNTVKSHAMAIYRKLGVTSRSAAVKEAADLGLLDG